MKYYYLILIVFLFSCTSRIMIKRILDGDTVISSTGEHIRLSEIDAPELGQEYGIESKNYLSSLILNKEVEIKKEGKDKYKRTIAKIFYAGKYINKEMVIAGEAWAYKKYSSLYPYELEAKQKHLGLWKYNNIVSPIEWRHEHKHFKN